MGKWMEMARTLSAAQDAVDDSDDRDISPAPAPIVRNVANVHGSADRWLAAILALDRAASPVALTPARWCQLLDDARTFTSEWGERAVALGWMEEDIFSVPPGPERWGRGGLIMALEGRPVLAMTDQTASIPTSCGVGHRYVRRPKSGAVMLWNSTAFGGVTGEEER